MADRFKRIISSLAGKLRATLQSTD